MSAAAIASLRHFAKTLEQLPRVVGQRVAAKVAPELTRELEATFRAGEDAYGNAWAPGVNGDRITLRKTGALARTTYFVPIGTKLRVALGVAYAKYQIGKRPITPRQGAPLPVAYVRELRRVAELIIREAIAVSGGAS